MDKRSASGHGIWQRNRHARPGGRCAVFLFSFHDRRLALSRRLCPFRTPARWNRRCPGLLQNRKQFRVVHEMARHESRFGRSSASGRITPAVRPTYISEVRSMGRALVILSVRRNAARRVSHPGAKPAFDRKIVWFTDFLPQDDFLILRNAAERQIQAKRVNIPVHKRGRTISYHELHEQAPEITRFYRSSQLRNWCSEVAGARVQLTPWNDLSSCSLLIYDQPNDHIGWHYDLNLHKGEHSCPFRRRLRVSLRNAAASRRATDHSQHDVLHRPFGDTASGFHATRQRHRIFRDARALEPVGEHSPPFQG